MSVNEMDRQTPRRKPEQMVVMRQEWHHLAFLHWEIPIEQLRPLVPERLSIDTFQGKAYVGIVPFTLANVRPPHTPAIPGISAFDEVNVRTYVHLDGANPGVFFFSLDASSILAVEAARAFYRLPYFPAEIRFTASAEGVVEFHSRRELTDTTPASIHVTYSGEGAAFEAAEGTAEFFLSERYILYAHDGGRLYRARVHHEPYPLQRARVERLDETLIWAAGLKRGPEVPLAHYARGVDVGITAPELILD